MASADKSLQNLDIAKNDADKSASFSDVPLSQESSATSLTKSEDTETSSKSQTTPPPHPSDDLSDQDTLVSDSEDQDAATEYLKIEGSRPRPSFTIGGSDSDSTSVTSASASAGEMDHNHPHHSRNRKSKLISSNLNTIPSDSGNLNNSGDGSVPQGRPGYMGGRLSVSNRSQSSQLDRSHSHSSHGDHSDEGQGQGQNRREGLETSYKEIRLFATNDNDHAKSFTSRQWLTFGVFGFVELFSAMVISLQAPFYPFEAEKKGASATEYGLVFGIFELTVFIISPIYGSKINKIGPKLVFNLGILVTSLSAIGFGFLDQVDNRTLFVGLSILIRVIEALGEAAFITASFVIIAAEFPHSVATTFAAMETFYGLGLIIGPLAGGLLYQIGGYTLPFLTVGGLLLVSALCTSFALPSTKNREVSTSTSISTRTSTSPPPNPTSGDGFKMFTLLTSPAIALAGFSIFSSSASISYLNATLEPFIREHDLSPSPLATGAIFIVNGGIYAITSPLWGYLCDRLQNQSHLKIVSLLGTGLIGLGFGLIGPIPYVSLQPSLWGVIVGQTIQGVGLGAVLVSAFIQSLREAIKTGLPDNVQTYSLVSGVWTSMFALGAFAGPTASGVLYDLVGFRRGTLSILGLELILAILILTSIFWSCFSTTPTSDEREDETAPLLENIRTSPSPDNAKGQGRGRSRPKSPVPGTSKGVINQRNNDNVSKNTNYYYGSV